MITPAQMNNWVMLPVLYQIAGFEYKKIIHAGPRHV
jgi:hypothetical protein